MNVLFLSLIHIYRTLRDSIADSAPLVGAFLPEWSLPNYITQAQLAKILGVPNTQVAMQEMSGYTLTLSRQCIEIGRAHV